MPTIPKIREGKIKALIYNEKVVYSYRSTLPPSINYCTGYQTEWPVLFGLPSDFYIDAQHCIIAPALGVCINTSTPKQTGFVVNPKYWTPALKEAYAHMEAFIQEKTALKRVGSSPFNQHELRAMCNQSLAAAHNAITCIVVALSKFKIK